MNIQQNCSPEPRFLWENVYLYIENNAIFLLIVPEFGGTGPIGMEHAMEPDFIWNLLLGITLLVLAFRAKIFKVRTDGYFWDGEFRAK